MNVFSSLPQTLRTNGSKRSSFLGLLMMLACQNAHAEQVQVFSLIAFLQIGAKYQKLTQTSVSGWMLGKLQIVCAFMCTFCKELQMLKALASPLPSVGVCVFVCNLMLSGSISSHSALVFTCRAAALKSKDKNRDFVHLSHCLHMEAGRFCSSHPLM